MTLVVEDGSVVTGAESYISAPDATAYLEARGYDAWTDQADAAKERALRLATDYMVQTYRGRWIGNRAQSDQSLDWPRHQVIADGYHVDSDVVPADVQRACALLAVRALTGDLVPDLTRRTSKEAVGPIEVEYDGDERSNPYRQVERLLSPYLRGGPNSVPLIR
ncbi:MAG: DnaT-like ssDNA-binding protein [Pseudomonadota bacterium]